MKSARYFVAVRSLSNYSGFSESQPLYSKHTPLVPWISIHVAVRCSEITVRGSKPVRRHRNQVNFPSTDNNVVRRNQSEATLVSIIRPALLPDANIILPAVSAGSRLRRRKSVETRAAPRRAFKKGIYFRTNFDRATAVAVPLSYRRQIAKINSPVYSLNKGSLSNRSKISHH